MSVCTDNLAAAKTALHSLLTGEQIVKVTFNGRTNEYSQTEIGSLRQYIRELESECGDTDSNGRLVSRRGPIRFHG